MMNVLFLLYLCNLFGEVLKGSVMWMGCSGVLVLKKFVSLKTLLCFDMIVGCRGL